MSRYRGNGSAHVVRVTAEEHALIQEAKLEYTVQLKRFVTLGEAVRLALQERKALLQSPAYLKE